MKQIIYPFLLLVISSSLLFAQGPDGSDESDETAITEVLINSYLKGIHIDRNPEAVRAGFHPSFIMHVYDDDQILQVDLDMWLDRLQLDGVKNPNRIKSEFNLIDISHTTAVVRMEIYENNKHLYSDFFGLYKFKDGWKIVNKIFYAAE